MICIIDNELSFCCKNDFILVQSQLFDASKEMWSFEVGQKKKGEQHK